MKFRNREVMTDDSFSDIEERESVFGSPDFSSGDFTEGEGYDFTEGEGHFLQKHIRDAHQELKVLLGAGFGDLAEFNGDLDKLNHFSDDLVDRTAEYKKDHPSEGDLHLDSPDRITLNTTKIRRELTPVWDYLDKIDNNIMESVVIDDVVKFTQVISELNRHVNYVKNTVNDVYEHIMWIRSESQARLAVGKLIPIDEEEIQGSVDPDINSVKDIKEYLRKPINNNMPDESIADNDAANMRNALLRAQEALRIKNEELEDNLVKFAEGGSESESRILDDDIEDPIRFLTGKYWTMRGRQGTIELYEDEFVDYPLSPPFQLASPSKNVYFSLKRNEQPKNVHFSLKRNEQLVDVSSADLDDEVQSTFYLQFASPFPHGGKNSDIADPGTDEYHRHRDRVAKFRALRAAFHALDAFDKDKTFEDFKFSFSLPVEESKAEEGSSTGIYSAGNEYNYFLEEYEDAGVNVDEKLIPNLYALTDYGSTRPHTTQQFFDHETLRDHVTLHGSIDEIDKENAQLNNKPLKSTDQMGIFSNIEYLEEWSREIEGFQGVNLENAFENLFFDGEDINSPDYQNVKNRYSSLFPYYNYFSFDVSDNSRLFGFISELNAPEKGVARDMLFSSPSEDRTLSIFEEEVVPFFRHEIREGTVTDQETEVWDLNEWMKSFNPNKEMGNQDVPGLSGEVDFSFADKDGFNNSILDQLLRFSVFDKITDMKADQFRSYEEILQGQEAYSEIVMYKLEKKEVNQNQIGQGLQFAAGQTVQEVFFINSNVDDVIDYIDTQVKFGKEYIYELYSYHFVLGNEYEYTLSDDFEFNQEISDDEIFSSYASIGVKNRPSYKLVKQKVFSENVRVLDSPPVYPQVEFDTFKDKENKLLLRMNSKLDSVFSKPIKIEEDDSFFSISRPELASGVHEYETDDVNETYEIFRLREKPESYRDFASGKKMVVDNYEAKLDKYVDASSVMDEVEPGETYYYTFRSRDVHNNLSIPSPVYVVKITVHGDLVFPEVEQKTIEELNEVEEAKEKPMRRFLRISPSREQIIPDGKVDPNLGNIGNLEIGERENPIFGKKFKIRLTSKSSGKKLDLNIKFEQNRGERFNQQLKDLKEINKGKHVKVDKESVNRIAQKFG